MGTVYAESGALELGGKVADILQVLPDEKTQGDVTITFKTRYTPTGPETTYGPYAVRTDGYTDTRVSGRQAKVRIDAVRDAAWAVGRFRADVVQSGDR